MKRIKLIPFVIISCLILWFCLTTAVLFKFINPNLISAFSAKLEIFFNCITVFLIIYSYKKCNNDDKKILLYLVISSVGLLLNDSIFYALVYLPGNFLINLPSLSLLVDMSAYAIWIIACAIFLSKLFMQYILKAHHLIKILVGLSLVNIIIISLYLSSIHYAFGALSWQSLLQIISTGSELIIFDLAIFCIIYSINTGLSTILAGFIVLIAGDCMIDYSYISQTNMLEAHGEMLWFLGILLIFFGALVLSQEKKPNVKEWLRKANAIKSKLAMWTFGVSTISILPSFVWIYFIFPNNKDVFLIFLPLIMITTVIVVTLSLVTGNNFERPFKKISENINKLMLNDDREELTNDFSIDEFIFLQGFIYDAYTIKEERDNVVKTQGELAAQVAHDIRSPVAALLMLSKESAELPEEFRVILRDAAHRIQDITNNLLNRVHECKSSDTIESTTVFLASTAILSVISEKKVEYKNTQISLGHEFASAAIFCFIRANLVEFKRMLSNLLNNAIESMDIAGKVTVILSADSNSVKIDIIDTGKGMPLSIIETIMKGEVVSNKTTGLGLGLSHARTFLLSCDAQLNISSTSSEGTMISLIFNKQVNASCWIVNEIEFNANSIIIILDDDISIHGAWDNLLGSFFKKENINLQVMHFTQGIECIDFVKQLSPQVFADVVMLADYELIKQNLNGLDVIEQARLNKGILVTSYDQDMAILKRAMLLNTQILPKLLISEVTLSLIQPTVMHEDPVDLVMLEDNKAFSDVVSYLYEYRGKSLHTYHDVYMLLENLPQYDKRKTQFCLDFDLGTLINGIELSGVLYQRGFRRLYLASGYKFSPEEVPSYLQVLANKMELLNL